MGKWTKKGALKHLNGLVSEITVLRRGKRRSTEHVRWLTNTLTFLEEVFGDHSIYYVNIKSLSWHFSGQRMVSAWDMDEELERLNREAYLEQLDAAEGFLLAAKDYLNTNDIGNVYTASPDKKATGELMKVLFLSENKLRKTFHEKPAKEKDVQDHFDILLSGADIEYKREAPRIEYSSKDYIPDFSFENIGLAVEIKLCNANEKPLIQQLNDDILAYKTQFPNILFIIYDLGIIRDVDKFKRSFENSENVIVHIIKH
jgi:hypothetical protein